MSVSVEVCKDIEEFQETVVAGMDGKHTAYAIVGIICGGAVGALGHFALHAPTVVNGYLAMFGAAPAIIVGFLNKDGMGFAERIKRGNALKKEGRIFPVSTESPEQIEALERERYDASSSDSKTDMKKQLKKTVAMALAFLLAFMILLIVLHKLLK